MIVVSNTCIISNNYPLSYIYYYSILITTSILPNILNLRNRIFYISDRLITHYYSKGVLILTPLCILSISSCLGYLGVAL